MLKNLKISFIISSILYIALGVVLLVWPTTSLKVICYAFGGITLFYGLFRLASYLGNRENSSVLQADAFIGIIMIGLGIFLLIKPDTILSILPIVLGLFIIFNSIIKLQHAFELKAAYYEKWWIILFLGIATAALGTVIVLNPFQTMEITLMAMGVVLIIDGVSNIFTILFVTIILKQLKRAATDLAVAGSSAETVVDTFEVETSEHEALEDGISELEASGNDVSEDGISEVETSGSDISEEAVREADADAETEDLNTKL